MDSKKYRYNHIGIPTTKKLKNEKYLADFDVYTAGYQENEFNIEWMKYGPKCKIPDIVKELPHVAFEVDDVYEAIKGHEVIIEPNSPGEGAIVAFVLVNDAPVEFIQFTNKELCEKNYKKLVKKRTASSIPKSDKKRKVFN
jgi:hypothetical protein